MDLGTGDARYVLAVANRQPGTLVLGVDADASSMVAASRRASARPDRGGLPNALFVVAAAERLPDELVGVAHEVTIHLPWGSLLRGLVRCEPAIVRRLAAMCRPRACVTVLLSVTERDLGAGGMPIDRASLERLAGDYAACGLRMVEVREATRADIDAAHSSWAKRLVARHGSDIGRSGRRVWVMRFERA